MPDYFDLKEIKFNDILLEKASLYKEVSDFDSMCEIFDLICKGGDCDIYNKNCK